MVDRPEDVRRVDGNSQGLMLGEFVRREMPNLRIVSMSQPEPRLARHNVVAVTGDVDAAREAVVELEGLEANDAKLGFVVMSKSGEVDVVDGRADPEGVTRMVAPRILIGGALGALAGALIVGGIGALFAEGSTALLAAIGGVSIGGAFGAVSAVFAKMGGSDAYRQSFVAPELADVCLVSLHTDNAEDATRGRERMTARKWDTVSEVDVDGMTTTTG